MKKLIFLLFCIHLNALDHDKLIIYLKNKLEKIENEQEKFDYIFKYYNKENLYKLFIDKNRLENPSIDELEVEPKFLFDVKEPGYYEAMENAFLSLPKYLNQSINLDMIEELHDLAVNKVKAKNIDMSKGIITGVCFYNILKKGTDKKALNELFYSNILLQKEKIFKYFYNEKIYQLYHTENHDDIFSDLEKLFLSETIENEDKDYATIKSIETTRLNNKLKPIIDHYYDQIGEIESLEDKLMAIGELLRALEVAHFLPDGNQRTYAFLLLNKLLLENNLPFCILENPIMFDGYYTVEDMAIQIKQGIYNFLDEIKIKKTKHKKIKKLTELNFINTMGKYKPFYKKNKNKIYKKINNFKNKIKNNNYLLLNTVIYENNEIDIAHNDLLELFTFSLNIGAFESYMYLYNKIQHIDNIKEFEYITIIIKILDLIDEENITLLSKKYNKKIFFESNLILLNFFINKIEPIKIEQQYFWIKEKIDDINNCLEAKNIWY